MKDIANTAEVHREACATDVLSLHGPGEVTEGVSVVMAVHNGRRFLGEQIASVLTELNPEDELLVVDDASSDNSGAWLRGLGDDRVSVHVNEHNLGVIASFEKGLSLASKEIVFLCDQDDVWLPGKRAAFLSAFESTPGVLVVISDAQLINADGLVTAPSFMAMRGGFRAGLLSTLFRNRYLGCAMAFRRELLAAALPIPRAVPMHDMWLGVLGVALGQVQFLPRPWLQYRRHGGNVSPARRQGWLKMLRWRLALLLAVVGRLVALRFSQRQRAQLGRR